MMEKLLQRDFWVKIFSAGLALLLWAFVIQDLSSQTRLREFDVELKVRRHAALRVFEGPKEDGEMRVVVRVEGSPLFVNRLSAADFVAEVDYTKVNEPGKTTQFEVKVIGPENAPKTTTITPTPKTVTAMLMDVGEKLVPAAVQPTTEVITFQGKEWQYIAAPAGKAVVMGRTDFLAQVTQANVPLEPADKVPNNTRISKVIVPLDASGKQVAGLDRTFIDVVLNWEQLPPGKQVRILPTTRGAPPTGFVVTRVDAEPTNATMRAATVGGKLPDLDTLETTAVDLTGQTKSFTTTARVLQPAGTKVTVDTVNVTVSMAETTVEKVFKNVPVQVHGRGTNVDVTLAVTEAEIRLKGPYTVINGLDASAVSAYVDVENLGEGLHRLPIKVIRPQGVTEEFVTPPTVEVTVTIK